MTFNSEKTVHVNAYTKSDGTHVKEHYRGGGDRGNSIMDEPKNDGWVIDEDPSSKNILGKLLEKIFPFPNDYKTGMSSNLVLEGGVSVDVGGFDFSNVLSAVLSVTGIALTVGFQAMKYAVILNDAIQKSDKETFSKIKPKFQNEINRIKNTQKLSDTVQKTSLKNLVNTKNQTDYEKAYKAYIDQRQLNMVNEKTIAKMEYAVENDDYTSVIEELNNYKSNNANMKSNIMNSVKKFSFTDKISDVKNNVTKTYKNTLKKALYGTPLMRTGLHKYPQVERFLLENGMDLHEILKGGRDGKELFKASLYNFEKSGDYIKKNGFLLNSTSELPPQLQSIVSNKLYGQIGVYDSKGIVFKPDSSISQSVAESDIFKNFVHENKVGFLTGETINSSVYFNDWGNTHIAIGHADIVDAFVDSEGTLIAKVIDVYDFNEGDPLFLVEWAHNLQELGMLTNFFTVSVIMIPYDEWIKM